ncbi:MULTISPECIES: DoxX family protein [unclassified Sphingobacterium]|uniref:DoxX family protein n=1 Tax=unclassified Sphingobacterium TaxID=2609468 RepID=UPI0025EE229C|nr:MULTISPECIES: DoxX family protein [unclassified Sphingobacterium]
MKQTDNTLYSQLFLRLAIGITLLSAVADRFGLWSAAYSTWGNMDAFIAYTGQITSFMPAVMTNLNAYFATAAEIILGILIMLGFKTRIAAISCGILLLIFALSMTVTLGVKATFDYSVWIGSAASFLLATQRKFAYSVDEGLKKQK